jgi:NAD(P)-dependent dehydrogenase (short-subunit alcohol dehydrogenase family)
MDALLAGKVAIVTGAGSGVGRAATLLFARHGAKMLAADIDADAAAQTAAMVQAEGGDARSIGCDVADAAAVDATVAAAVAAYGRLDIMFNNAGVTIVGSKGIKKLVETTPADIERLYSINVLGVVHGCQAAARQFDAQKTAGLDGGPGVIVNTASIAGLIGFGGVGYGATKGAVASLTRTLALELGASGIRVNAICPAGMLTHFAGMNPNADNADAMRQGMGAMYPLGRAIDPIEAANAALFLASDMSSAITGVNLPVDCGLSAGIKPRG